MILLDGFFLDRLKWLVSSELLWLCDVIPVEVQNLSGVRTLGTSNHHQLRKRKVAHEHTKKSPIMTRLPPPVAFCPRLSLLHELLALNINPMSVI